VTPAAKRLGSRVLAAWALTVALTSCSSGGSKGPADAPPPGASSGQVSVSARAFSFSPATITVKQGQATTLTFKATDIAHDFTVDNPKIHIAAQGGKTASGQIKVDQAGTYTFYCSVSGHKAAGMVGKLVVTP
jgi:plastocyanin